MRILIVRIGRTGDIVMTTPALNAILDKYPDASITILTGPDGRRLLKGFHPRIKDLWIWDRSGMHGFFGKRKILKMLASNTFDIIYCFDTSNKIASLFDNSNARIYRQTSLDHSKHCAVNYLETIEAVTGNLDKAYYASLPVDPSAEEGVKNELLSHGIKPDNIVVMLHPSYSGYTTNPIIKFLRKNNHSLIHRFWPPENFGRLADLIATHTTGTGSTPKIIIDLVPEEAPLGTAVLKHSEKHIELLQVTPNFERYKALIKRADLLVTPNTGPMHIAAAVGTKVVALFSDWNPSDCGPYMINSSFRIIRAEDMKHPEKGLSAIGPESVLESCKALLD